MFYCTVYTSRNKVTAKNKTFELALCLSYPSEADANRMKDQLLQQAADAGATIIEDSDTYRTVYGNIFLKIGGIGQSNFGTHIYSIGVETVETRFSRLPDEVRKSINLPNAIKDGYRYERLTQDYLQNQQEYQQAEQDKVNNNLSRFEAEVADITELDQLLRVFLKYAKQKTDKEKLIALVVKKIQGELQAEKARSKESADWYDELSDINN